MSERDERERKVPQGRLGRFARMALTGVRAGAGMLLDRDASDAESAAKRAADVLGHLRGLAAKAGQAASYVDGVIPEAHRDAYEKAMKHLRAAAPVSPPREVHALVEQELGAPLESLFTTWHETPIASASIGQVHRARVKRPSGEELDVAVKVQHPGIDAALEHDLQNIGMFEGLMAFRAGPNIDAKQVIETIQARLREELDYALEAERLRAFHRFNAGEARSIVPAVIDERSSARVLTTEFIDGLHFDAALAAPEADRRAWAETMWRFVFRNNLLNGLFNADPHPGNYLFLSGGRVAFLDFGCVQALNFDRKDAAHALHRAACDGDEARFYAASRELLGMRPGRLEPMAQAYARRCFEPLFASPYRITRSYAGSLVDGMKEIAQLARTLPPSEAFQMPPDMIWVNRLQFGFYSVLARLDVEVDYREIERAFLATVAP